MNAKGVRINYGKFVMSAERIFKNTIIGFKDDFVEYSYLLDGCCELLNNCGIYEGDVLTKGMHRPIKNILYDDSGKLHRRYIAVHEDGILCCFISPKQHIDVSFIEVSNETTIESNTQYIVMEGMFTIQEMSARQYDFIVEREQPTPVYGNGVLCKIKFLESRQL